MATPMEKSDELLAAEYLAGNEDAFASLLARHLKSVYSFAARSAPNDAEDIAQDTFLKAWKNLKGYEPDKAQFKTWLMRIARNTVIDYLRKRKTAVFSEFENEQGDNRMGDTPDEGPLPDEIVARAHDAHEVEEVLEKLPPPYREVILLRYTNQLSFDEIGEVLHEPSNTVRSRHRRGLVRLKELLQELHQKEG